MREGNGTIQREGEMWERVRDGGRERERERVFFSLLSLLWTWGRDSEVERKRKKEEIELRLDSFLLLFCLFPWRGKENFSVSFNV